MLRTAVVVPVKGFSTAKSRLAATLDRQNRAELARRFADTVVAACWPLPVFVACDDDDVAAWATSVGATVVWTAGKDLNGACAAGIDAARADGADGVIVAHADLPGATDLAALAHFPGVTLVPDLAADGTNVVVIPPRAAFVPMYGPGSFTRHLEQALALGLPIRICRRAELQLDVDAPADLEAASR